jgi:hypothetical protein
MAAALGRRDKWIVDDDHRTEAWMRRAALVRSRKSDSGS